MYSRKHSSHRRTFNIPRQAHELTFTCYHRYRFLEADRTRLWLVDAIQAARIKLDFAVWAYVIMPEHVHLIVCPQTADYAISNILYAVKKPVGRQALAFLKDHRPDWLPRLTRQRGARTERLFWQSGGGYDRNIDEPATLELMITYIHQNPVRRGLVERAVDWPWSSAGWFECGIEGPLSVDRVPLEWTTRTRP